MERKILIVDDDLDLVRSFQVILESRNFSVITATHGIEGFDKLKTEKPDLMVLDVMMDSNLDGYNILHTIKQDPMFKELPIILLTGMIDELGVNLTSGVEDEAMFPNVRFQDKPVDPMVLVDLIEEMLKSSII